MSERRVGFSGSRRGLSEAQREVLRAELEGVTSFHHGDCVGADAEAHAIAVEFGAWTEAYPSNLSGLRAQTKNDRTHAPKHPLARNHDIVNATDELIACPDVRSRGTKQTIYYAYLAGKPHTIIYPDGTTERVRPRIASGDV